MTQATERGVSIQLAEQRKSVVSNVSYSLSFSLQPSGPIDAGVAINFDLKDKSKPVVIDFNAPKKSLKSLTVNYRPAEFEFKDGHIVVSTDNMVVGENAVIIDFQAGDSSLNRNEKFLYTLLVPDRASTVFPCFDQPDMKANFALQLNLPPNWIASANADVEREIVVVQATPDESKSEKRKVVTYQKTKPISTYLFAFAAGEFQKITREVNGRSMTMLHRESDTEKVSRNVDKIFETHGLALNWLEDYTNIEYPFEKFDFVLIPSFQYGGMEHIGNIFYNADQLFLDQSATKDEKLNRASLIAHETAHMWFGNLVTMKWFNDVWLKEVFANFMAAKIVHPSFPEINHDLGFLLKHHPRAYGEDRSGGSHPIQQKLGNLKDAGTLYGRIIYQKAPIVMRQLETMIGDSTMRDGLRQYLKEFSYDNAVWDDLIKILDAKTQINLTQWSDAWVKQPGTPELESDLAARDADKKVLTIRQTRKTSDDKFWSQQVDVKVFSKGEVAYSNRVMLDGAFTEVALPDTVDSFDFYMANGSELGYGYFKLDRKSRQFLLSNIHKIKDDVTRGAAWLALYESLIRGTREDDSVILPDRYIEAIAAGIQTEAEPLNRQNLLNQLETVYWKFLSDNQRAKYAVTIEKSLWSGIESNQLSISKDDRAAYYKSLVNISTTSPTIERLFKLWETESDLDALTLSENDFMTLACQLAVRLPDKANEILEQQLSRIKNEDRKKRFQFVMQALTPSQDKRDTFFESLKTADNRRPERWVLEAVSYLHHPLRASQSEKYILPSLELLEEIQSTGDIFFPKRWLVATFGGHRSKVAADIVRKFVADHPEYPYRLKNKILQAADLLLKVGK